MNRINHKKGTGSLIIILTIVWSALAAVSGQPLQTAAKVVTSISKKENTSMPKLTPNLMRKVSATTPAEPAKSDLTSVRKAALLSTRRIPQGYTTDGTYYYYLSVMATHGSGSNDLRLTRIGYQEDGTWTSDYMTLVDFGHGTNLDCVNTGGKTWLWTGSDCSSRSGDTTSISCFTYRAGKTLKRHARIHYRIRVAGTKSSYAGNVFPAISADGKKLAVRYIRNGRQRFQVYALKNGRQINTKKIQKSFSRSLTKGPFQGFDIRGTTIYTIEGSAFKKEMKILGKRYRPIIVKKYNYKTGKSSGRTIQGAKKLSHREPEGVQVSSEGEIFLMIASHYKEAYTCVNIYKARFR